MPLTTFVGREHVVADVAARLQAIHFPDTASTGTRLLTLTGPGGGGKSRIAIVVASVLKPAFSGGVRFVPLAAIRDSGLVLSTIALAIGARQDFHNTPMESIQETRRDLGEPSYNLAFGHYARGIVAEDTGNYPLAVKHLTLAVATFQSINQHAYAELARFHLGVVLFGRGDLAEADAAIAEALQRLRDLGCHITVAATADFHGLVAFALNNPAAALERYRDALTLTSDLRTPEGIVRGLAGVAIVAAGEDPITAARLFAASAAASESSGYTSALPERAVFDRATDTVRAVLGRPSFQEAWAAGQTLSPDQALAEAVDWLAAALRAVPPAPRPQVSGLNALTPRERQVLRLLVAGRSNKDIAVELFISTATVKRHVSNILAKLEVTTRSAAIAHALVAGRVSQPPES